MDNEVSIVGIVSIFGGCFCLLVAIALGIAGFLTPNMEVQAAVNYYGRELTLFVIGISAVLFGIALSKK